LTNKITELSTTTYDKYSALQPEVGLLPIVVWPQRLSNGSH